MTAAELLTLDHIEELDRQQKAQRQGLPFWRVSRDTGALLHILARARETKRAVEVGTSSGYSGIFIASALRATGGHLWTFDLEPFKVQLARDNFERAGLSGCITQVAGDALQTLPAFVVSAAEPLDFVFLDALKPDYIHYFNALAPRFRSGTVICADNVGRHAQAVAEYLRAVRADPFETSVMPTVNSEGETDAIAVSIRR